MNKKRTKIATFGWFWGDFDTFYETFDQNWQTFVQNCTKLQNILTLPPWHDDFDSKTVIKCDELHDNLVVVMIKCSEIDSQMCW